MFISTLDTITKLSTDSWPDRDLVRSQEGVVPDPDQSTRVSYRCGSIDRSARDRDGDNGSSFEHLPKERSPALAPGP